MPDLIPLDDLLPHCKVLVTNGGYGAFQHTISNRTPLVIAGAGEEKPEVAARAKWVAIGINLRTGSPKPEQVRTAVERLSTMASIGQVAQSWRSIDELAAGYS